MQLSAETETHVAPLQWRLGAIVWRQQQLRKKQHNTHKTPNKIMNRKKKKKKKMNIEAENTNIVLYRQVA